jgi:hypothetical protein
VGITAAIKGICDLLVALLKSWSDGKPGREEAKHDEASQQINRMVAEEDVDALAARVDAIRRRLPGKDGVPPGKQ